MRPEGFLRVTALALAALMLLGVIALTSCSGPEAAGDEPLVATVNTQPIRESDLRHALLKEAGPSVLVEMIDEIIIRQAAQRRGLEAAPEQVDLRMESMLAQAGGTERLEETLRAQGLNREKFREQIVLSLLLDALVREDIAVNEEEIQQYYQDNLDRYSYGPQVKGRMILVETRENAEALREALEAGGDFAGLAQAFSQDPATAGQGGDMGWFEREDYAQEITDVAFGLEVGEVSPVLAGPDGFYLLKVEDKQPAGQRPVAEMRDEMVTALKYQKLPAERRKWLLERRQEVRVTLSDPALRAAVEKHLELAPPPSSGFGW